MTYRAVQFIRFLSRDTLEKCIIETYNAYLFVDPTETLECEIRSLLFHYLKEHNITRELAPICKRFVKHSDLNVLKEINEYNYNKLKLIL